jgi:hypothetical protein
MYLFFLRLDEEKEAVEVESELLLTDCIKSCFITSHFFSLNKTRIETIKPTNLTRLKILIPRQRLNIPPAFEKNICAVIDSVSAIVL